MSARAAEDVLVARLSPEAGSWLRSALEAVSQAGADDEMLARWSGAGRRLGRAPVVLEPAEVKLLAGVALAPRGWGADEWGRTLLLLRALEARPPGRQVALVEELYRTGETRERQAVLRALIALPDGARFVDLAVEAVRANVLSEIEAIACENAYPARHFSEEAFNQMVLKCLFNGIPLARIEGLVERRGAELRRMVAAYAAERRAAGRTVPDDVALVLDGGTHAPV